MKKLFTALLVVAILMVSALSVWAYVDDVISVVGTFGAPTGSYSDPLIAEGKVNGPPDQAFIQIADNSIITMRLDPCVSVDTSTSTSDLIIDTYDQPYPAAAKIEVSYDGSNWYEVFGPALNDCEPNREYVYDDVCPGMSPGDETPSAVCLAHVDLTSTPLDEVCYVRMTDYPGGVDGEFTYPLLGFDLDAIYEGHQFFQDCQPVTVIEVGIDIKPQSCPNPLNTKDRGVVPVAILGTEDFDVTTVDPASVRLEGVAPLRWAWEDVATPFDPFLGKQDCFQDCTTEGPDGYLDLTLKFHAQEVIAALGEVADGDCLVLGLTGNLKEEYDGGAFVGEDVVWIKVKGM